MRSIPKVYIAGVGLTATWASADGSSDAENATSVISAVTKALLDAGITYDAIDHSLATKSAKVVREAFQAFDPSVPRIDEAKEGSQLKDAVQRLAAGRDRCMLIADVENVRPLHL